MSAEGIDPLQGANCSLCPATADNFHVSDELWERVGLGQQQVCFKCFRIAAWHKGIRPETTWEVLLDARPVCPEDGCHERASIRDLRGQGEAAPGTPISEVVCDCGRVLCTFVKPDPAALARGRELAERYGW